MRNDDEHDQNSIEDCELGDTKNFVHERTTTTTTAKRSSLWQKEKSDNESEEELTGKDGKDGKGSSAWNQRNIVKIQTFTIEEDRI